MEVNHGPRPAYPTHETIIDQLRRHVAHTPDAPAVVAPEGEHSDGSRLTMSYAELWAAVHRAALGLVHVCGDRSLPATHPHPRAESQSHHAHARAHPQACPCPCPCPSPAGDAPPGGWVLIALPQGVQQVCAVWATLAAG